jgi:hypothetical protein
MAAAPDQIGHGSRQIDIDCSSLLSVNLRVNPWWSIIPDRSLLTLACRTVMTASSRNHDTLDRRLTYVTQLTFPAIDAMPQLKKTFFPIGIHVVGDGGATQANRLFQNLLEGSTQNSELFARKAAGTTTRPDAGSKQGFIGINVANPAEQFLVQQGALDRSLPPAKELYKIVFADFKRLQSGSGKIPVAGDAEAPKAAWVDETYFPSRSELGDRMGMLLDVGVGRADQHLSCHPQVHDPLPWCSLGTQQVKHDLLANAADCSYLRFLQGTGNQLGRRFQGFFLGAKPDGLDYVASDALRQAARHSFNFRQFRHIDSVLNVSAYEC